MRVLCAIAVVIAIGCAGEEDDGTFSHEFVSTHTLDPGTDTDTNVTVPTTDPTVTVPDGLNGSPPQANLPVPSFDEVVAMDGTARTSADLVGRPTVMWFYPAAFTGG